MMKRLLRVLPAMLLLASLLCTTVPVHAETNLIANPGAETASGTQPANWVSNSWGTNAATFTYQTSGHSGSRSLRANVTAYTNGDAKWIHNPVAVTSNTSYTYTDWYRSSIATELVLEYTKADNTVSYVFGQPVAASSSWKQTSLTFTTPANVAKVSVFHVIAGIGWLETDDFSLAATNTPPPTSPNLIANPSFETANGNFPAGWSTGRWGTNTTTFNYANIGRTGNRSAQVQISAYSNGDAKWYSQPATVTPGKTYTYSDYHQSTRSTTVIAAYTTSSGALSYVELGTVPAAASWTAYSQTFTVPANIATVTIYHVIAGVGSLNIDDVSLVAQVDPGGITIPNASVEQGTTSPTSWETSSWGANTPSFQYVNEGHNSSKSVKVTMANYTSGDAKWLFNPIKLDAGKRYRFTAWYKSNVAPEAVAMFIMADGSAKYFGMPDGVPGADAAATWQKYTDTFSVPAGAVGVSVFLFINKNGWLQTDDYSLSSYTPVGFNRPLLSLTFDDGHEENADTALPPLNQYGFKSTQCYATSFIEGQPQSIKDKVLAFRDSGHEICSHSVTHPEMTTLNDAELDYEARHSKEFLESLIGQPVTNFATPFGDYNERVNNTLRNYYQAHRTVDEGYNSKDNFDRYRLRVQNILKTTTASEITNWINQAKADKTWLILVYHRIADDPGQFDTYRTDFPGHLQAIQASGITVKTYKDALSEVSSQL